MENMQHEHFDKGTNFLSLLQVCLICRAIFHHHYSIYSSVVQYFVSSNKKSRCTPRLTDFVHKASQLYTRMVTHVGNNASTLRQIKKTFQRYHETFVKYCKTYDELTDQTITHQNLNFN